ncbi:DUF6122 family protein [Bowmanella pacifica]|uniref:Uncharacterized protein n=1 Tax=Bowmanella pacifica TaxID=502051 RepID=A0A917Z415_9ALTE|nr:DUF6122 family protein [Bowmanella pacifica]GGO74600.1 hypothetical protein GCM10010982_37810 [Bowmanella pacifica]
MLHILLHALIPLLIALSFAGKQWRKAFVIMMLTMLVDLDHLLATPIYDPQRCSIGFHPLHQWPWFILYGLLAFLPKTRWIGVGLVIHMLLDWQDCYF